MSDFVVSYVLVTLSDNQRKMPGFYRWGVLWIFESFNRVLLFCLG